MPIALVLLGTLLCVTASALFSLLMPVPPDASRWLQLKVFSCVSALVLGMVCSTTGGVLVFQWAIGRALAKLRG
jgi:hypothetical protein